MGSRVRKEIFISRVPACKCEGTYVFRARISSLSKDFKSNPNNPPIRDSPQRYTDFQMKMFTAASLFDTLPSFSANFHRDYPVILIDSIDFLSRIKEKNEGKETYVSDFFSR